MGNEETQVLLVVLPFTGLSFPLRSAVFTLGFISQELRSQGNPRTHTLQTGEAVPGSKVSSSESEDHTGLVSLLTYPQGNQGPHGALLVVFRGRRSL